MVPPMNGKELRAVRERAGLSQESIAPRIGVTLRTVQRWEKRETDLPQRDADAYVRAALRDVA